MIIVYEHLKGGTGAKAPKTKRAKRAADAKNGAGDANAEAGKARAGANARFTVGPVNPGKMVTLGADLASSGVTVTCDSGDPCGHTFLIEGHGVVALATWCADSFTLSILRDPERAFVCQIKPVIRKSLGCGFQPSADTSR
jgi:hypothetical protein